MEVYNEVPRGVLEFMQEIRTLCESENPAWADVFENVYANTLQRALKRVTPDDTYVLTGDIPAMWLRDSTAQVRPYLPLINRDADLKAMLKGVIKRQLRMILYDPYANAFNESENGAGHQSDHTVMRPLIWERKYEIDSLCYPLQLAYLYYQESKDASIFDDLFHQVVQVVLTVWRTEQDHETSSYTFERDTTRQEDTLANGGWGHKVAYTGMTWSGFRPSDDACEYNYLVPANMFAVVILGYIETIYSEITPDKTIVLQAQSLREEIIAGIEDYAIAHDQQGREVYAYEVDGLGNQSLMDDPNVPSLLAAPYLGFCSEDDVRYRNTRDLILSPENRYFYEGKYAAGCGSSHTPPEYIWPIALAIEGLTTSDHDTKRKILNMLVATDGGTQAMHESFNVNDPTQFTRAWFSWANMMFCELLMDYFNIKVKR